MKDDTANKIADNLTFEEIKENMDLKRYEINLPALKNEFYRTNLLLFIEKMPEQPLRHEPKILKINPANNIRLKKQKINSMQQSKEKQKKTGQEANKGFQNIVLAFRHEVDGLGNETKINQYQVMKKLLGKGSHCFVKLAKKQADKRMQAIKTISLERLKKKFYIKDEQLYKMINNQIQILLKLKHPNIIKLQQAVYAQQADKIFLILQNCAKDLSKAIRAAADIPYEAWIQKCKKYCKEIALGLQYIHESRVLHRDIKTENILIDDSEAIKIIDFNVSMQLPSSSPMITITDKFVGTKAYAPPELVIPQNKARTINGMKVDVWALGITFYELIERTHPWTGKTIDQLINFLKQPQLFLKNRIWIRPTMDPTLKDLLQKMLKLNNAQRIDMNEVVKHPWLTF